MRSSPGRTVPCSCRTTSCSEKLAHERDVCGFALKFYTEEGNSIVFDGDGPRDIAVAVQMLLIANR